MNQYNINRFLDAQNQDFESVKKELTNVKKTSHFMWYMFPQIHGLGKSTISKYYSIKSIVEATYYINNDILYQRLNELCQILLSLPINDPISIFGDIDSIKLQSSMTLFNFLLEDAHEFPILSIKPRENIFKKILEKYFNGKKDNHTINILYSDIYYTIHAKEILNQVEPDKLKRAYELLYEYSEFSKPITILNKTTSCYPEDRHQRDLWFRFMKEEDYLLFSKFQLDVLEEAKKIRNLKIY